MSSDLPSAPEFAVLINGQPHNALDSRDRGLSYGDGVFRTLRCQQGRLLAWNRHYAKLAEDCRRLGLACPSADCWLQDIAQLKPVDAVIKLILTRGTGQRGYVCSADSLPTRLVQRSPLPRYADTLLVEGATLQVCQWRLGSQPGLAGIKHLNRLEQVMARREWQDPSIYDGLMLNGRDELVEGVISNLFLLRGRTLQTHPLRDCGVAGVSRAMVLELAKSLGWQVSFTPPVLADLMQADEAWLCNSLAGIVPIGRAAGRTWQQFAESRRLSAAWWALANADACVASAGG